MKATVVLTIIGGALLMMGLGCGEGGNNASPGPASKSESVLEEVKKSGEVIIGVGMEAAPFGFRDGEELVGFDVDIARAVAAKLETYVGRPVQLQFKPVTDETRIGWVQSGEVHLSLCHTNNTRKRDANIDFTVPYGWDGKGVLYDLRKGQRDLSEFKGATIGIKRSSSSEGEIQAYFEAMGWEAPVLKQFDNHTAGIQALVDGQIDGFTDDNSIVVNTAVKAGHKVGSGGILAVTDTPYSPAFFGIGVPENDSDWRDTLNYCLHDLWESGEFQEIYDKWFGPDSGCPMPLGANRMEPFVKG